MMVVVPGVVALTRPVADMLATVILLLLHVPVVGAASVVVSVMHSVSAPVMGPAAGNGSTCMCKTRVSAALPSLTLMAMVS